MLYTAGLGARIRRVIDNTLLPLSISKNSIMTLKGEFEQLKTRFSVEFVRLTLRKFDDFVFIRRTTTFENVLARLLQLENQEQNRKEQQKSDINYKHKKTTL